MHLPLLSSFSLGMNTTPSTEAPLLPVHAQCSGSRNTCKGNSSSAHHANHGMHGFKLNKSQRLRSQASHAGLLCSARHGCTPGPSLLIGAALHAARAVTRRVLAARRRGRLNSRLPVPSPPSTAPLQAATHNMPPLVAASAQLAFHSARRRCPTSRVHSPAAAHVSSTLRPLTPLPDRTPPQRHRKTPATSQHACDCHHLLARHRNTAARRVTSHSAAAAPGRRRHLLRPAEPPLQAHELCVRIPPAGRTAFPQL
jgi:hypothetical protein